MDILALVRRDHDDHQDRLQTLLELLDWRRGYLERPLVLDHARRLVSDLALHADTFARAMGRLDEPRRRALPNEHAHQALDAAAAQLLARLEDLSAGREDVLAEVVVLQSLGVEHHREATLELVPTLTRCCDGATRRSLGTFMASLRLPDRAAAGDALASRAQRPLTKPSLHAVDDNNPRTVRLWG